MESRFGIELELVGDRVAVGELVLALVGGFLEPMRGCPRVTDRAGRPWRVIDDPSIEAKALSRCEIVSPPLEEADLAATVPLLVHELRRFGAVNESCGLHVHVESGDADIGHFVALLRGVAGIERLVMHDMLGQHRGRMCHATPLPPIDGLLASATIDELWERWYGATDWADRTDRYDEVRYRGLNLHSHRVRGTVEFRYFNGSLDPDFVLSCVRLARTMMRDAGFSRAEVLS